MRGKKEALTDFVFLGSKITLDGDCIHEIKMCLFLRGKLWQVRQHIKKQRHHFANKSPYSRSCGFSSSHVWMWESEHKTECWRINAFKLWCWIALLRFLWITRRSNQSILKKINPEYLLEGLMLKLKLQYVSQLIQRAESLEKALMLGKIQGRRRIEWQDEMDGWHHQLNGHEFKQTPRNSEGQESLACFSPWGRKGSDTTEHLNYKCEEDPQSLCLQN